MRGGPHGGLLSSAEPSATSQTSSGHSISCSIAALPRTDDRGFWLDVLDWLSKYSDHEPDWADGCLAVLSGRDARLKVWTYDREFRTTWRRPDGTAIPMAVSRR